LRPLCNEGDILVLMDSDTDWKFYMVQQVEDFIVDKSMTTTAPGTLGPFTEIAEIEPEEEDDPFRIIYQVRMGVDIGMIYTEMLAGHIRRTPYRQRRPTSSAPYCGYFNEVDSPYCQPEFEFFLRYNERPAFAIYNPWGFTITPRAALRGRKLKCLDLEKAESAPYLKVNPGQLTEWVARAKNNSIAHRRITMYGIER